MHICIATSTSLCTGRALQSQKRPHNPSKVLGALPNSFYLLELPSPCSRYHVVFMVNPKHCHMAGYLNLFDVKSYIAEYPSKLLRFIETPRRDSPIDYDRPLLWKPHAASPNYEGIASYLNLPRKLAQILGSGAPVQALIIDKGSPHGPCCVLQRAPL